MRLASIDRKLVLLLVALIAIPQFARSAQKAASAPKAASHPAPAALDNLPKLWHSEGSKHDFRVTIANGVFRAEWVNLPAEAAKQGAYIRTECRRSGAKWIGSSRLNMLFAIPGAAAGKDTKLCNLTVRFEVDSVTPDKIVGHSEKLADFDVNTCKVRQTGWGEFTWTPKK